MATTHFIITKLPDTDKFNSFKGLDPLVENTLYPIADQPTLNFTRVAELDGYFVSGRIYYKAYDENLDVYGNEAYIDIAFKESDAGIVPASANFSEVLVNDDTVNLLEKLPLNSAVEFIEIVSIEGVRNHFLDGQSITQGKRISTSDLLFSQLSVLNEGGGAPYSILTYKVGKEKVVQPTEYTYQVDVVASAELNAEVTSSTTENEEFDNGGTIEYYDVIRESTEVIISKGSQNGTAQIQIDISAAFLVPLSADVFSEVLIKYNGQELVKTSDEIFVIDVNLDKYGKSSILIDSVIVKDEASESGQIDLLLQSINNDNSLVSATNSVSIVTDIS